MADRPHHEPGCALDTDHQSDCQAADPFTSSPQTSGPERDSSDGEQTDALSEAEIERLAETAWKAFRPELNLRIRNQSQATKDDFRRIARAVITEAAAESERRVAEVERELDVAKVYGSGILQQAYNAERRLAETEARARRLREALVQYGDHYPGCTAALGRKGPCTCGFGAALAATGEEGEI